MTRRHGMNPRIGLLDFSVHKPATEPLGTDPASMRDNVLRMAMDSARLAELARRDSSNAPELSSRNISPFLHGRDRRREFDRQQAARVAERKAEKERLANYTQREPCGRCGVRADQHAIHGCKRLVL